MSRTQAIQALDELDITDPEHAHYEADEILLKVCGPEIRAAYESVVERCAWWACA